MHVLVGVAGGALVLAMASEVFVSFVLPRRVKRDPRLVRAVVVIGWRGWRSLARRLEPVSADTLLGLFGPLALLTNLVLWVAGMALGYACLQWAAGSHLGPMHRSVDFGQDLYFSAATMTTDGPSTLTAHSTFARVVQVLDAGSGLAVLAIVIGYMPSLFQAFSSREATVSQLDARAGSPPSAGRLVLRSGQHGGWPEAIEYLGSWEQWMAELMETHLSYPPLAYFRSQHVNQNWLSAMSTVLDACALTIACAPEDVVDPARFTYAIARHAAVDLAYTFRCEPIDPSPDRLPEQDLRQLLAQLREAGLEPAQDEAHILKRVSVIRSRYEPYINALSLRLELPLPPWLGPESATDNWRTTEWH